jgi:hypothetical protein
MFSFGQPAQNSQQPTTLFPQANAPQSTPSAGGLFSFGGSAGATSQTQGMRSPGVMAMTANVH